MKALRYIIPALPLMMLLVTVAVSAERYVAWVVGDSKKYHTSETCSYVKRAKAPVLRFTNVSEAAKGRTLCHYCETHKKP